MNKQSLEELKVCNICSNCGAEGVNPVMFKYVDDPQQLLYMFDNDGNILLTNTKLTEVESIDA